MQGEPLSGPFFGVFDCNGWCIAAGQFSDHTLDAARERLNVSTVQDVMNRCRVVQTDRAAYGQFPKA